MRKVKIKLLIAVLLIMGMASRAAAVVSVDALKLAFIYRFLGYVEWVDHQENFYVCIPDDEAFRSAAREALNGKTASNRKVTVIEGAENCHILVTDNVPPTNSVFTIGPLAKGAILEFRVEDNKLRFAVSLNNMKKSQLKLSSQLLKLAIVENGNST